MRIRICSPNLINLIYSHEKKLKDSILNFKFIAFQVRKIILTQEEINYFMKTKCAQRIYISSKTINYRRAISKYLTEIHIMSKKN